VIRWYRSLPPHKRLVFRALLGLLSFHVAMNVLYFLFPVWSLNWAEWNMLVVSADTSIGAIYYSVKAYYMFNKAAYEAKTATERRLGGDALARLSEIAARVDEKISSMPPEQRERLLRMLDRGVDLLLGYLDKLSERDSRAGVRRRIRTEPVKEKD